jgi:ribosomal protein L37AE/L43A
MTTASKAFLCPQCSSPTVDTPVLVGGAYKCTSCGWEGEDPILIPFGNPYGSEETTFKAFTEEFLKEFAKTSALPLGKILVKWGFVERDHNGKPHTKVLARYIKAMAEGMITALLRECRAVEEEKAHARSA